MGAAGGAGWARLLELVSMAMALAAMEEARRGENGEKRELIGLIGAKRRYVGSGMAASPVFMHVKGAFRDHSLTHGPQHHWTQTLTMQCVRDARLCEHVHHHFVRIS